MLAGFDELSFAFVLRMFVSVVYLVSGAVKIFDVFGFYRVLKSYRMFPEIWCELASYFLPPFQIVVGVLLFTKSFPFVVLFLVSLLQLFLVFLSIFALKKRGQVANCGVLGTAVRVKLSWMIVFFNIVLFFAVSFLLLRLWVGLSI